MMRIREITRAALALLLLCGPSFGQLDARGPAPERYETKGRDGRSHANRPPNVAPSALAPQPGAEPYSRRASQDALKWADGELKKMSLEEKIGQLISVGVNARFLNQESEEYKSLRRQVEQNHVGGIILFRGPVYESVHLVNRMQQHARRPLLISADLEAGAGMRFEDTVNFPWNMAVGATGNPEFARRQGEITAKEARALGVQQIFAPVVDVNNNAANPVINVRSYGEDPAEVAKFAAAFTGGAQGAGVIATAKHFPGHGDTSVDSHRGLPVIKVSRARLDQIELIPFRAAIGAGVGAVMSAHIGLPEIDPTTVKPLPREDAIRPAYVDEGGEIVDESAYLPGTLSPTVLGGILKKDLGFDGMVVTDALDMSGLTIYFKQDEAAVRAVLAGADMLLKPADPDAATRGLREAVKSGRLTERRIEESARKILASKYDLGLVKQRVTPLEAIDQLVSAPEALRLAEEIAGRAVTLVRDEAKLLQPEGGSGLRSGARVFNLAITNGEDRFWIANSFASQLARLGRRAETVVLDSRSTEAEVAEAIARAQKADVVVASMYGRVRSGASNSVGLPEQGARALNTLLERKVPVVGVSFGNPYLLQNFPALGTYVVAYGDMPSLQRAAARALAGQADITGRLPISLPGLYPRGTGIQLKATTARAAEARP
ncbi:MAG TPA: glycoside hydrolase family 3 N-terminal domain-containing protein [Pyrinomonadaceae bacterium]|nr:glycoside hydrolase family 3 N-terminal domain-containing protein [Pyrinomonadaceae bacterium]